jgi:hypothetical protein
VNDGQQFILSGLKKNSDNTGTLGAPYDAKQHNAYRFASTNFDTEDIKQYHLTVTVKPGEMHEAEVWFFDDNQWKELAHSTTDQRLAPNEWLTIQGSMPKALTVQRKDDEDGCYYKMEYALPADGVRFFKFNTMDSGYGKFAKKNGKLTENYCAGTTENDAIGMQVTKIRCSFPGW